MLIIAATALVSQGIAADAAPKLKPQDTKSPVLIVEPDQTDIFAIPLDEDAQDIQEQVYELDQHDFKKK
jgi:hypothetical protein